MLSRHTHVECSLHSRLECSQLTTHNRHSRPTANAQHLLGCDQCPLQAGLLFVGSNNKHGKTSLLPTMHTQLHAHQHTLQDAYHTDGSRGQQEPTRAHQPHLTLQDDAACVHVHTAAPFPPALKQQLVYKNHKAKRRAATDTLHIPHRGHKQSHITEP